MNHPENPVRPLRVFYIVYWGAGEAKSWILPHVRKLAGLGAEITLFTFEKPLDLGRHDEMARIQEQLARWGVSWIRLRYHKRPKTLAKIVDLLQGWGHGIAAGLRVRPDVIHARTFMGGLLGLVLARCLRTRLIYHNEGFYPDEQVDGGVWKVGSLPHRIAHHLEQVLYGNADGIICMSHRSRRIIECLPSVRHRGTPVIVTPAGVDLDHFPRRKEPSPRDKESLKLVYIGSIGGRYLLREIGHFVTIASREIKRVHLQVLTAADQRLVRSLLKSGGLVDNGWSVDCVPNASIPDRLSAHDAGLFFLTQGLSDHGCCPTKIGEYWASGLPVITTPNVGDIEEIIRHEHVGVIVKGHSEKCYREAIEELRLLLEDKGLRGRCRMAAENHYGLDAACRRQFALYWEVDPSLVRPDQ